MTSPTRIKLCGLRTASQVALAADLGVDFIGIMFAESSRRRVTVEEARKLLAPLGARSSTPRRLIHEGIPAGRWFHRCAAGFDALLQLSRPLVVGVFVDQPPALVNAIADALALDAVQLSGQEPAEQSFELRRPVIKAVHVDDAMTVRAVLAQCEVGTAALCLLDTSVPGEHGGTGRPFDWGIAAAVATQVPCMLAGGLTPDNVVAAIKAARPWAVDVSSGIETDGVKDEAKMRAFAEAVAQARPAQAASCDEGASEE